MKKSTKIILAASLAFLAGMLINNGFSIYSGMPAGEIAKVIGTNMVLFIGECAIVYTAALGIRDIISKVKDNKKEKKKEEETEIELENTKTKEKVLEEEKKEEKVLKKEKEEVKTIDIPEENIDNTYNYDLETNLEEEREIEKPQVFTLTKKKDQ